MDKHRYIVERIEKDDWMMNVLQAVKSLDLSDWWICAGFVRSKIWDDQHGFNKRTPLSDIDVVYFDPENISKDIEKEYERILHEQIPGLPWSVKNQARMHLVNDFEPYSSAVDAISKFPETVTALGVTLNEKDEVILAAPCGLEDVFNLEVRPTDVFRETEERRNKYRERVKKKDWVSTWHKVKIMEM